MRIISNKHEAQLLTSVVKNALLAYKRELEQTLATGLATEHSYRPAMQTLIQTLGGKGVQAINEPKHVECGAPDFIVERDSVPIGHVECKDIGSNLESIQNSEQIKRYRNGLPNLIVT